MNVSQIVLAVGLLAAGVVSADEAIDLATYWETPPTEAQTLAAGEYTLSADYTLPVALNMKQGSTYDFSAGGHTLTLGGDLTFANPFLDRKTVLRGGAWDLGDYSFSCDMSQTSVDGWELVFDGTAVSVKRAFLVYSGAAGDALFALTNGATLTVTGGQYCEYCRRRTSPDHTFLFDISTGSKLTMSSAQFDFTYTGGGDADILQNNTLRVRDSGSEVDVNTMELGQYSPGNALEILKGGKVSASSLRIGQGGRAHDNTVTVSGANSILYARSSYIGESNVDSRNFNGTSNNWVRVLDGATATLSIDYYYNCAVGPFSPNNGVYVSNATLKTCGIYLGKYSRANEFRTSAAGSNNVLWVTGPDAKLDQSYAWENNKKYPYRPFGAGERCEFRIEDGATAKMAPTYGADICGTNCLFRVAGANSVVNLLDKKYQITGRGNRLEILDGGKINCGTFHFDFDDKKEMFGNAVGTDNTVVVSNGLLTVNQYYGLFVHGDNRLILRGNRPRVQSSCDSNFYLYNGAKLIFELPLGETYDTAYPPLEFDAFYVTDGTRGDAEGTGSEPEILFPNIRDYQKSLAQPVDLLLGNCYCGHQRMRAVIEAASAKLPAGCRLRYDDANHLKLRVRPYRGTALVIR